ncbi:hypothetical protein J19TS2_47800 [Cohnella xylanilytica]|uniref:RCC1 domain-containing protein n=1 Tax=Cohnella xylanilytica TaxID=557555 RepID=UPI001B2EAD1A|nr:InlB B-repeat-containing protein [Cohnella xylanilytica]GIO15225.1 hypothetical protein J19TS2_47800 [Cohnella xylanilytica]
MRRRTASLLLCLTLMLGMLPLYPARGQAAGPGAIEPQLLAGYYHSVALASDGKVWNWGGNEFGGLGNGSTTNRSAPVAPTGMTDVKMIAAGVRNTFAVKNDGTLWAWGSNVNGQLGDGTTTDRLKPVLIGGIGGVKSISGGIGYHTLAVKEDGTVWAWGLNSSGELGDGTTTQRETPIQVPGLTGVKAVSAGGYHSLALKEDGTVWAWGNADEGEMGNGTEIDAQLTPVQVQGLTDVVAISAGNYHNFAIKSDGTLWGWGDNNNGRLGDGTGQKRKTPVQITALGNNVAAVSAGGFHSLALTKDGTVWAWGFNGQSQLGIGNTTSQSLPQQVPGLSGVTRIAAGAYHSLAMTSEGMVWGWGYNGYGQLGNGNFNSKSLPSLSAAVLDTSPPTVANGTLTVSSAGETEVSLSWEKATDNMTAQGDLEYLVYLSKEDNIGTVGTIENGRPFGDYEPDIDSATITGLIPGTTYYINVLVADYFGESSVYATAKVTTKGYYKVLYYGNGNTGGSAPSDLKVYREGETATVLGNDGGLARDGYTFVGWNTAADGTGTRYSAGDPMTFGAADAKLYADWSKNPTFSVIYHGNGHTGGTVPADPAEYEKDESATVLGNDGGLTKPGHTFAGWNTAADGSGTSYAAGDAIPIGTADVDLYAVWTKNPTFSVIYHGNGSTGGTVPTDGNAYEKDATATVLGNEGGLEKDGFAFAGWNTAADGSGTSYAEGDTFQMGTADVELYAVWTENPPPTDPPPTDPPPTDPPADPTYGVVYHGNGHTGGTVPVDGASYKSGDTVTVRSQNGLTKDGFDFAGWNTAADGSGTSYAEGDTFQMGTADVELYAVWTENPPPTDPPPTDPPADPTYGVVYHGNGNTGGTVPVDKASYKSGDTLTVRSQNGLTKDGFAFAGWSTAADGSGTNYAAGDTFEMGTTNVDLYAVWTENPPPTDPPPTDPPPTDPPPIDPPADPTYGVVYHGNGNTGGTVPVDKASYKSGDTVTVRSQNGLTKDGFAFAGWNMAADGSGTSYAAGDTFRMGTSDAHLFAVWTLREPDDRSAALTNLVLSAGTLSPSFDKQTASYSARVGSGVKAIQLLPTASDADSTITASVYDTRGRLLQGPLRIESGKESEGIGLAVGANLILLTVNLRNAESMTYTLAVTRSSPPAESGGSAGPAEPLPESRTGLTVLVDGLPREEIAYAEETTEEGRTSLTVKLDSGRLNVYLAESGSDARVLIPVSKETDEVSAELDGETVRALLEKRAEVEIRTPRGSYTLPASAVGIDRLAARFGVETKPEDIRVRVLIRSGDAEALNRLKAAGEREGFGVVASPVEFEATASHGGQTIALDRYGAFVRREIPLPEGATAGRSLTAVVLDEDGSVRHAPTTIETRDGKTYAVVHSLADSTYALVSYSKAFEDMNGHWASEAVANLASRLIVAGADANRFRPDATVSRAEFAAIVVRALGLSDRGDASATFRDVEGSAWYSGAVAQAAELGLLQGYEDGSFRPTDALTREGAVAILARVMELAGLDVAASDDDVQAALGSFRDGSRVGGWAKPAMAAAIRRGLVNGSSGELHPQGQLTRAETAVMVERLLIEAGLIDGPSE